MSPSYAGLVNTKMMTPFHFSFTSHPEDFESRASHLSRFLGWSLPCRSSSSPCVNGEPPYAVSLHDTHARLSPCMLTMFLTRLLRLSTWHEPRDQWQGPQLLQSRTKLTVHARGTGMIFIQFMAFVLFSICLFACFRSPGGPVRI